MNQVDLLEAQGVPLQSSLMLVNSYVVTTARFLNHFSALAEEKLSKVSDNITRMEVELSLVRVEYFFPSL